MAPKTLDLNTHAKTFANTYAHARRTGADRPLAHRFGLADVLGEIEEIVADRVEKAVAAAKAEHERSLRTVRDAHAAELAKLRPSITATTITADRITGGRYRVVGTDVHDSLVGDRAPFGDRVFAVRAADALNRGLRAKSYFAWGYARPSAARFPF